MASSPTSFVAVSENTARNLVYGIEGAIKDIPIANKNIVLINEAIVMPTEITYEQLKAYADSKKLVAISGRAFLTILDKYPDLANQLVLYKNPSNLTSDKISANQLVYLAMFYTTHFILEHIPNSAPGAMGRKFPPLVLSEPPKQGQTADNFLEERFNTVSKMLEDAWPIVPGAIMSSRRDKLSGVELSKLTAVVKDYYKQLNAEFDIDAKRQLELILDPVDAVNKYAKYTPKQTQKTGIFRGLKTKRATRKLASRK